MASQYETYHGMQVAKEAFLEVIMALQPARMYLRAIVPLLLIQIGRDNEAYNFIKFWLKNTPKGIEVYKDFYCCFSLFSQYCQRFLAKLKQIYQKIRLSVAFFKIPWTIWPFFALSIKKYNLLKMLTLSFHLDSSIENCNTFRQRFLHMADVSARFYKLLY